MLNMPRYSRGSGTRMSATTGNIIKYHRPILKGVRDVGLFEVAKCLHHACMIKTKT